MPKKETLIELVERLDRLHESEKRRGVFFIHIPSIDYERISKAVRELRTAAAINGDHELLARLDEGEENERPFPR